MINSFPTHTTWRFVVCVSCGAEIRTLTEGTAIQGSFALLNFIRPVPIVYYGNHALKNP